MYVRGVLPSSVGKTQRVANVWNLIITVDVPKYNMTGSNVFLNSENSKDLLCFVNILQDHRTQYLINT